MKDHIKVAIIYNEPNPELYQKKELEKVRDLDFIPYFEVDNLNPMEEYEILAEKLRKNGLSVYTLNIIDNLQTLLESLKNNRPDLIFNFIEIYKDNARLEMNIVGLYEILEIPYTGAPPMALTNCQSKVWAKRYLNTLGIRTPRFTVFKKFAKKYNHTLNFPIIVKPAFEDASVGIENDSIVTDEKLLKNRIEYVLHYFNQPVLIEEFIEGRELNVAVMGDKKPRVLPISEITFHNMPDHLYSIVSYQAKWDPAHIAYHKTIPVCPAILPPNIETEAKEIALNAFKAMGCRDYARVDIRLSADNKLYVLEVNPNPDLTEGAGFMRSAEAAGYSYTRALRTIINFAWARRKM